MQNYPIRVGVAYDHTVVRKALTDFLSKYPELKVVIDVATVGELLKRIDNCDLDVLLFEPNPSISSSKEKEVIQLIRHQYPNIKVIIMSPHFDIPTVNELLELGIHGYLSRNADSAELLDAIKTAARGIVYQNKILFDTLNWRANHPYLSLYSNKNTLSENQRKVLLLLWEEKSTKEIADDIFLSISAVEKIKQQLKEITGAKTTIGLIRYALEQGVIQIYSQNEYLLKKKLI